LSVIILQNKKVYMLVISSGIKVFPCYTDTVHEEVVYFVVKSYNTALKVYVPGCLLRPSVRREERYD
jgi:hypothetical protein